MARKYPVKVTASMYRVQAGEKYFLIRQNTKIKFGSSNEILASVFMTNPGSFEFKNCVGWEGFKNGQGSDDIYEGEDYPDLTMQNLIEVLSEGFKKAKGISPSGVVNIFNISNVVQPKGSDALKYHENLKVVLTKEKPEYLDMLIDPVTNNKEKFLEVCSSSRVIILGFVADVFAEQANNLILWSCRFSNKVVAAVDNKNRYSHPRRWRTGRDLKQQAINSLVKLLSKNQ